MLETAKDGKTRWIQLRIPVTEGPRYRVGEFAIDGNTVVKSEALMPLFKVNVGDWYNEKNVRDGLVKAREIYGGGGYMEFTGFPDIKPSDDADAAVPDALRAAPAETGAPTVDVTMRLQEGQAVLRQPHHLRRQHHDARQRDPPRDAAGRGRRSSTPRR